MSARRQLWLWILLAVAACALLVGVLLWQRESTPSRWSVFLAGNPHLGRHVFEEKACAQCHTMNEPRKGTRVPDLGFQRPVQAGVDQLVAAMWNHAPRMWEAMQALEVPYPDLSREEMAHLFAYLYTARYVEEPGDARRGGLLFDAKRCSRCHALYGRGGSIGPDLADVRGRDTPIVWTQVMWNHAPSMEREMRRLGLPWPRFEGNEMNDLLAYIREVAGGPRREFQLLPADPKRGRELFEEKKSCVACHSVKGVGGQVGPELAPRSDAPITFVQFAGAMWNHSPEMWQAMEARDMARPTFEGEEMADLFVYLYSVGYFASGGLPETGKEMFDQRGCSYCHGPQAEGTSRGPRLRPPRRTFTSTTLATALWRHGPKMYERAQELHRPWPTLEETDITHLTAFLNLPLGEKN